MTFQISPDRCFINAPFDQLEERLLGLFLDHGLQPEIGLEGDVLYNRDTGDFIKVATELHKRGLSCTLHAPFFDLSPGALDHNIQRATREKLKMAFNLIEIFKPQAIICHLNFEENKHGYKVDQWFQESLNTWQQMLELIKSSRTIMMLENTYEKTPAQHLRMLNSLNSDKVRFCLDSGHVQAFARNRWQDWLPVMDQWLAHLHLHDNSGQRDDHLAIGRGRFDFAGLFNYLDIHDLNPFITLEPHTEDDLWASLEALKQMGVVDLMPND